MRGYYASVEAVLRERPELARRHSTCAVCGIPFFCDPRNVGRTDLRCPIGCREAHRKAQSTKRSVAYYRTDKGRDKKKTLNGRRYESLCGPTSAIATPARPAALRMSGPSIVTLLLPHLCMVLTLIEGRVVTENELRPVLERISRQRRTDFRFRQWYLIPRHTEPPP